MSVIYFQNSPSIKTTCPEDMCISTSLDIGKYEKRRKPLIIKYLMHKEYDFNSDQ